MTLPVKLKGVSSNYLNFLWQDGLHRIWLYEQAEDYVKALRTLCDLIKYLDKDRQKQFIEQARTIEETLAKIQKGSNGHDYFQRRLNSRRQAENYARRQLNQLLPDVTTALDESGYYEVTREVDKGYGSSWRDRKV